MQARLPGRVMEEAAVRELLELAPTSSIKDIQLQLQTAQNLFYGGLYLRAEHQLDAALAKIQSQPPGAKRWNLHALLLVYRNLALKHEGRTREARESAWGVLRVQPDYQLDPAQFAPQTRRLFEELRKDIAHSPHYKFEVTSEPSGATVYIDGFAVGKTPYASERVAGTYQVILSKDGKASLPHTFKLSQAAHLAVDLSFEGALSPERLACIDGELPKAAPMKNVLMLGSLLSAEEVVLLSLDRAGATGPGWLKAFVLNVGSAQVEREGGIRVLPGVSPPEGLEDLVTFVLTGQPSRAVVQPIRMKAAPGVTSSQAEPAAETPSPGLGEAAGPEPLLAGAKHRAPSKLGWSLLGAGVLGVGVWTFLELQATSHWNAFNQYYATGGTGPGPADVPKLNSLRSRSQLEQTLGAVAVGAGVACLAGSAYVFYHRPPATSIALTGVGVNLSGTSRTFSVSLQLP